jgi:hypothetical protein
VVVVVGVVGFGFVAVGVVDELLLLLLLRIVVVGGGGGGGGIVAVVVVVEEDVLEEFKAELIISRPC